MAMDVLWSCVPEMLRRVPIVEAEGDVAQVMKECLAIVEPNAQTMREKGGRDKWAISWRRLATYTSGDQV